MVVKVKLKRCKKATTIGNVISCWKEEESFIILTTANYVVPAAIVYDIDEIEDIDVI